MEHDFLNLKCNKKQTYLEFIRESEKEFDIDTNFQGKTVEEMDIVELQEYIAWIDYLWQK